MKFPQSFIEKRALEMVLSELDQFQLNKLFDFLQKTGIISNYKKHLMSISPLKRIQAWSKVGLYINSSELQNLKHLIEMERDRDVIAYAFLNITNYLRNKEDLEWFLLLSSKYLAENLISENVFSISLENILKNMDINSKKNFVTHLVNLYNQHFIEAKCLDISLGTLYFYIDKSLILEVIPSFLDLLKSTDDFSVPILKILTKGDERFKEYYQEIEKFLYIKNPLIQLYVLRIIASWKCDYLVDRVFDFVFSPHWYLRSEAAKALLSFDESFFPYIFRIFKSEDEYAKYSMGDEIAKLYMMEGRVDKLEKFKVLFPSEWQESVNILDTLGYKSFREV
ncbi:MAG: hypothetical protein QXX30_01895 [Candidatus Aenigmatarchaeota archaeon]